MPELELVRRRWRGDGAASEVDSQRAKALARRRGIADDTGAVAKKRAKGDVVAEAKGRARARDGDEEERTKGDADRRRVSEWLRSASIHAERLQEPTTMMLHDLVAMYAAVVVTSYDQDRLVILEALVDHVDIEGMAKEARRALNPTPAEAHRTLDRRARDAIVTLAKHIRGDATKLDAQYARIGVTPVRSRHPNAFPVDNASDTFARERASAAVEEALWSCAEHGTPPMEPVLRAWDCPKRAINTALRNVQRTRKTRRDACKRTSDRAATRGSPGSPSAVWPSTRSCAVRATIWCRPRGLRETVRGPQGRPRCAVWPSARGPRGFWRGFGFLA